MSDSVQQWLALLRTAQTEAEVIRLVRQYVESIPAETLEKLPESCRPRPMSERDEVAGYNVQLAREELTFDGPEEVVAALRAMLGVMTEGATRLAQLSGR